MSLARQKSGSNRRAHRARSILRGVGVGALSIALVANTASAGDDGALIENPSGTMLGRRDMTIPGNPVANGATIVNSGITGYATADFGETYHYKALNNDESCFLLWEYGQWESVGANNPGTDSINDTTEHHPYVAQEVEVLLEGEYTFRVVGSVGIADPYVALYQGSFSASAPDTNAIGCNDDSEHSDGDYFDSNGVDNYEYPTSYNELWSEFIVDLQPGSYVLLLTSYCFYESDQSWYEGAEYEFGGYTEAQRVICEPNGDLQVTAGSPGSGSTTVVEYWGPEGGMNLGGGSRFDIDVDIDHYRQMADELPDTGGSLHWTPLLPAAVVLATGGLMVFGTRRRRTVSVD